MPAFCDVMLYCHIIDGSWVVSTLILPTWSNQSFPWFVDLDHEGALCLSDSMSMDGANIALSLVFDWVLAVLLSTCRKHSDTDVVCCQGWLNFSFWKGSMQIYGDFEGFPQQNACSVSGLVMVGVLFHDLSLVWVRPPWGLRNIWRTYMAKLQTSQVALYTNGWATCWDQWPPS